MLPAENISVRWATEHGATRQKPHDPRALLLEFNSVVKGL